MLKARPVLPTTMVGDDRQSSPAMAARHPSIHPPSTITCLRRLLDNPIHSTPFGSVRSPAVCVAGTLSPPSQRGPLLATHASPLTLTHCVFIHFSSGPSYANSASLSLSPSLLSVCPKSCDPPWDPRVRPRLCLRLRVCAACPATGSTERSRERAAHSCARSLIPTIACVPYTCSLRVHCH